MSWSNLDKMQTEKRRVFSIGAWSPALRSQLGSTIEPCGCVVGVYQAWSGEPLRVVDVPNPRCADLHRAGDEIPRSAAALQTP